MDAKVLWHGGLNFTGTSDSGFELSLGAAPKPGKAGEGFRPMELMALSLAGCTAMDVISIMEKKRQDVTDFEVRVLASRAQEHPKVFTDAVVEYEFTGRGIKESAVIRSIQLSSERYCPAQAMLSKVIPLRLDYAIYEGDSRDDRSLSVRGTWSPAEPAQ